jgi:hypothetical protein
MRNIGIGYCTYKRKDNWKKLILKPEWASEFVAVNDGTPYPDGTYPDFIHVIQNEKNRGIGISKNNAMKHLLSKGCDHIFLVEDDIIIKDPACFERYIQLAEISKIRHLNFGYHGLGNVKNGKPNPRFGIEYDEHNKMAINYNCVGAFSYYHRTVLEKVGLIDEAFVNAFDHVEHTYRIIQKKLHPPFWNFADVWDSNRFFDEIGTVENNSVIRKNDKKFQDKLKQGRLTFQMKHGIDVLSIPDCPQKYIYQFLEKAQNENA